MARRNWIKIYPEGFLRRTLYKEMPDIGERYAWIGFLCLAGDNSFDGKISITETMGYTDEQLAGLLDMDLNILKSAKKKMIKYDKISVDSNNVIQILSWKTYQSEYNRQRDYREEHKELQRKVTTQSYNAGLHIDRDRDIDIEEDIDIDNKNKEKIYKKEKHLDFVLLTEEEHKKLIEQLGEDKTKEMIEKLNNYIGSKGKKYKSHYHTILNWVRMEQDKGKKNNNWRRT
jgi:hypothetical protein